MKTNERDDDAFGIEGVPPMTMLPSGCWVPDTRATTEKGYVVATIYGRRERLHRHVYRIFVGPLGKTEHVRHTCDTPGCCCPWHLLKGSNFDNVQDRVARGRSAAGERHPLAKFSNEQAAAIYLDGTLTPKQKAERHGVSLWTIYALLRGETYQAATEPHRKAQAPSFSPPKPSR